LYRRTEAVYTLQRVGVQ